MKYTDQSKMSSAAFVVGGTAVNVVLSFLTNWLDFPMYLDTIGTIIAAAVGGMFPGIVTAVATNLLCSIFDQVSIYFSVLNVLIAICSAYFVKNGWLKKAGGVIGLIAVSALIGGCGGALIQWALFGAPQYETVAEAVGGFRDRTGIPALPGFVFLNFLLNLVDKGITVVAAMIVLRLIPERVKLAVWVSGWRQRPLSESEIRELKTRRGRGKKSLQARMTWLLVFAALSLTVVMVVVSARIYGSNVKKEYTENARSAARFAAEIIDAEMIDTYLAQGEAAEGYTQTREMLYRIRDNSPGVAFLYVVRLMDDGCHFVFDLDTEDTPAYGPGDVTAFEEAFLPYLPALFAGEEIDPIESDDITGWVLTVYQPVYNDVGRCVCYVGVDVSMLYLSDFVRDFVLRAALVFSGFFILILAFGLWTTSAHLVYPINSMAICAGDFMNENADQSVLDEHVSKIKGLEIATEDEVENLYEVLCRMMEETAEQLKNIRYYSNAVAQMQNGLIITMADMVENRDSDTGAHIQKTAAYVKIILEGLKRKGYYADKLTPKYMSDVEMSAPLHDVGKINIPDAILNKPGKLTPEEFEIMKTHTTAGKQIMERAISTVQGENYLKEARNMAAYHHEKWDGSGYPEGLYGEVIPLSARVMAVADVFDALASKRVYKDAMPFEKAIEIIQHDAGSHFDPKCVEAFMDSLDEVKRVMKKYQDS